MKFGRIPLAEAEGAILAHTVKREGIHFKKGRVLDARDVRELAAAGLDSVVAARLEAGEIGEDEAADRVTRAVMGGHLTASAAFTGRCNVYSTVSGVMVYDGAGLDAINLVDEAVTVAALPPFTVVAPRQMVATVKIIPYGVASSTVDAVSARAARHAPVLRVAEFIPLRAGLVQSGAGRLSDSVLNKTRATVSQRLARLGSELAAELRCDHHEDDIGRCLGELVAKGCDLLLIAGASATADRNDVVPAGIVRAGGTVTHMGMPVEPGNLLLLGETGNHLPVVCLPGCARSPALNGFDWVLERLLARIPVRREDIMRMGAGGLIKHQNAAREGARARTRNAVDEGAPARPAVAAVVLAAGDSREGEGHNPLLAPVRGEPALRRAVCAAIESQAEPVVVVVGAEAGAARSALAGCDVTIVENEAFAEGISSSLRRGIAALPEEIAGAVICLGDMPWVRPRDIDRLIAAFDPEEGRLVCVAAHRGQRGHPVLWERRFFGELEQIRGEAGAKALFERHGDFVCEVEAGHDGVLREVQDTESISQKAG